MAFSQNGQGYLLWDLFFHLLCGFGAIILAPDKLESQSGANDSDHSLVSTKNLSEKMARWVDPTAGNFTQKCAKTRPHYDITHTKPQTQNETKIF